MRLAHRIDDLDKVPYMSEMPAVIAVKQLYTQSFLELLDRFPKKPSCAAEEEEFAQCLESIYERHSRVLVQMARGAYEFRDAIRNGLVVDDNHNGDGIRRPGDLAALQKLHGSDTPWSDDEMMDDGTSQFESMKSTHAFLDRFFLCRIGIRVMIGQYLALRQPPVENYVGIICSQTSPYEIVKRAIDDAAFMCTRKYGDAPDVVVTGRLEQTFPYVPTHLRKYTSGALQTTIVYCSLLVLSPWKESNSSNASPMLNRVASICHDCLLFLEAITFSVLKKEGISRFVMIS